MSLSEKEEEEDAGEQMEKVSDQRGSISNRHSFVNVRKYTKLQNIQICKNIQKYTKIQKYKICKNIEYKIQKSQPYPKILILEMEAEDEILEQTKKLLINPKITAICRN